MNATINITDPEQPPLDKCINKEISESVPNAKPTKVDQSVKRNKIEADHNNNAGNRESGAEEMKVHEWVPVAEYAPEFLDTDLDIPDVVVEQEFFQHFVQQERMNANLHDIMLAYKVIESGKPNRYSCRIPLDSIWKLDTFTTMLFEYEDLEVIEWLRYGFTVSRDEKAKDPTPASSNHLGATLYPAEIDRYIEKELSMGALIGPFQISPFLNRIGVSLVSTTLKRNSMKCRIIMDLSWLTGQSVNDGIDKDMYDGEEIRLTYPSIDTLMRRIAELGVKDVLLWKKDMIRAFKQIYLCPQDYSLIGYRWRRLLYFDKTVPMGLCSAAYICQRVTNAIVFVHRSFGYWSINYLDDFG